MKLDISQLSKRENEIMKLMISNKKCAEMSKSLFISINTVKVHRKRVLRKLGCSDVNELIIKYFNLE